MSRSESVTAGEALAPPSGGAPRVDYQLLVFSGEDLQTFDLPKAGTVTIGRGKASAVRIDNPSVSRNHAVLHVGAKLVIEDLGSNNGTMIREKAGAGSAGETLNVRQLVGRSAELGVGDSMLLGTASMVVRHAPTVELPDLAREDPGVIVQDPAMRAIHGQACLAARTLINVLILGETGVGKEVLARAIHAHSQRSRGPFLAINCAALSESLQESELFGYEKGAFTGAAQVRAGLFEAASGGTVFLDEVGELAATTQAKLLRVLAERTVIRLGSSRARPVDARIVAATNRDVEAESKTGKFRQDLYFRLNGISLLIPPLRERLAEVEPFARMFLAAAARGVERSVAPGLATTTLDVFCRYAWPGNVRELRNVVERAVVLCQGDTILPEHLPSSLLKAVEARAGTFTAGRRAEVSPPAIDGDAAELRDEIKAMERARITEVLERLGGNQTRAAKALGISRGTLISRLRAFGLNRPRAASVPPHR